MRLRYLTRFIMIAAGFGLTVFGTLSWHDLGFDLASAWPLAEQFGFHPVYPLTLGMALIPPSLWEVFVLEANRTTTQDSD